MSHVLLEIARLLFALLVKLVMPFVHVEDPVREALDMIDELGGV